MMLPFPCLHSIGFPGYVIVIGVGLLATEGAFECIDGGGGSCQLLIIDTYKIPTKQESNV
jgi:hypothetical protein